MAQNEPKTVKVPTQYRRIPQDETLWIIFDGGNTDVKAMVHDCWNEEVVFPHAVQVLRPDEWEANVESYRHRVAHFEGSAIFEVDGEAYSVGDQVKNVSNARRLIGPAKYEHGHLDALFITAMEQLYAESHPDVRVVFLHPADITTQDKQKIVDIIGGIHKVTMADGRKIKYTVRSVIPVEEPVAGLQSFLLNQKGFVYKREDKKFKMDAGKEALVLDTGGGLSAFVAVRVNRRGGVEVNLQSARDSIVQSGIQDVTERFQQLFRQSASKPGSIYPAKAAKLQALGESKVHQALMTGELDLSVGLFPCEDLVEEAMRPLAEAIYNMYARKFGYGLEYGSIIQTGGGGGIIYNYMLKNVLEHPAYYLADDDVDAMRFVNIRGASKNLHNYLSMRTVHYA